MPASDYIRRLRDAIGHDLLLIPSVAAIVHDEAGRLLLQRKGDGWSLPAGAIEPGESPDDALLREVLEETGRPVIYARLVTVVGGAAYRHTYSNGDQVEYTVVMYRCALGDPTGDALGPETVELRYFDRHEMPPLAMPYPMDLLFSS